MLRILKIYIRPKSNFTQSCRYFFFFFSNKLYFIKIELLFETLFILLYVTNIWSSFDQVLYFFNLSWSSFKNRLVSKTQKWVLSFMKYRYFFLIFYFCTENKKSNNREDFMNLIFLKVNQICYQRY